MNYSRHLAYFALVLFALILAACGGSAATAASSWPGITVDQGSAYVAYGLHVYAVNLSDGKERWRFPQEADQKASFYAAHALTPDGQLIVGGYNHILYSLDPQSGKENWSFTARDRFIGSPLVTDAGIFAPSADHNLYTLDFSGKLRWTFRTQGALWAQPISDPECTCIYLPSMDHRVYAIDIQSGVERWKTEDLGGAVVGTPAYVDGVLYVGTFGREMVAIEAQNGHIRWRKPVDGWVWGGPAYRQGMLYFGDLGGSFYAMEATSGEIQWKLQPDGPIAQSPWLGDEALYFSTEVGSVYAVDYSGSVLWSQAVGGKLYTTPVLAGDKILVATTGKDEIVFALDKNGTSSWAFVPEKKK